MFTYQMHDRVQYEIWRRVLCRPCETVTRHLKAAANIIKSLATLRQFKESVSVPGNTEQWDGEHQEKTKHYQRREIIPKQFYNRSRQLNGTKQKSADSKLRQHVGDCKSNCQEDETVMLSYSKGAKS